MVTEQLQRLAGALGIDVEELYATAGYLVPSSLPELRPYLRAKYGISGDLATKLEGYVEAVQDTRRKGVRHDNADEPP